MLRKASRIAAAAALLVLGAAAAEATPAEIARGKYLVAIIGCTDCHTQGGLTGHMDRTRFLGGSDVGFAIPGLGVFDGPNLTPDKTGLGAWSVDDIVTAITQGKRPDGRMLAPVMPYGDLVNLTPADARAIAVYLKTIKPLVHANPGPWGPSEKPTVLVMPVVPAEVYVGFGK